MDQLRIYHVTYMHVVLLLFGISLLLQFEQIRVDQKQNVEPFINHATMNSLNPTFGPLVEQFKCGPKSLFDHVILNF